MKKFVRKIIGFAIIGLGLWVIIASLFQVGRDWHWLVIALIGSAVSVSGYGVVIGRKLRDVVRDFIGMIRFAP